MSLSHKSSRLALNNQIIPVKFNTAHFNFKEDTFGIQYGGLITPIGSPIYTVRRGYNIFGNAVAIEEGTTNLETNNPITFSGYSWGWTTTQVVEYQGRTCLKLRVVCPPNQANWTGAYNGYSFTGAIGDWCTRSCEYLVERGSITTPSYPRIAREGSWTEGNSAHNYDWSKVGEWQRLSVSGRLGATSAPIYFYLFSKGANDPTNVDMTMYIFNPQAEKKIYATSFTTGTRTDGQLRYPIDIFNPNQFTVSMWFNIPRVYSESTGNTGIMGNWYHSIFEVCPTSNRGESGFGIVVTPQASYSPVRKIHLRSPRGSYGTTDINDNTWYHLIATFDGTTYKVYINGNLETSDNLSTPTMFDDSVVMVGGGYYGKSNSLISELRIDPVAVSGYEAKAWYESRAPYYNPYDYRAYLE